MSMTNDELRQAIEDANVRVRTTAPDSPGHDDVVKHLRALLLEQQRRASMPPPNDESHQAAGAPVERPVRPKLPERDAARVYAELREMGYTWHQAHETMARIAEERARCARCETTKANCGKHHDRSQT